MHFTTATVIVPLLFVVAAAPQPGPQPTDSFLTIPLTRRSGLVDEGVFDSTVLKAHAANTVAGLLHGFANYEVNTGTVHPSAKTFQKRGLQTGSVPLTDDWPNNWYASINVGTPPVTYKVGVTTRSSDLFLPGSDCDLSCSGHSIYFPSDSWSSSRLGKNFILDYGRYKASGVLYNDTVQIGGLIATQQTLGVASYYAESLAYPNFTPDGSMGLAYPQVSNFTAMPLVQNIMAQGKVASIFSLKLGTHGSELFIGGANRMRYDGDIVYTRVTVPALWQFNIDRIKVSGVAVLAGVECIADTDTNLIVGDTGTVAHFYEALNGRDASSTLSAGFYTFPCANVPSISFTIGDKSFYLSRSNFVLGPTHYGSSDCIGRIVDQKFLGVEHLPFWILGQAFLTEVYTVFDVGNNRIGFADPAY